jgi:hypothetical protein
MGSPKIQLKDFIYLDIDRVKSFVAQLYEGVPETFEEISGREKGGTGEAGVDILGLIKVGAGGSILYQKSTTETKSVHRYLYTLLEQKLMQLDKLVKIDTDFPSERWRLDTFEDGEFVLTNGRVQITNYRGVTSSIQMIPKVMEIGTDFQKQALKQRLMNKGISQPEYEKQLKTVNAPAINKKDVEKIAELIEKFYSDSSRVKVFPFKEDNNRRFVGNTVYEYFTTSSSVSQSISQVMLSGTNWYVMGLVNKPESVPPTVGIPASVDVPDSKGQKNLEDSLEGLVLSLQEFTKYTMSIDFPAISLLPIAIYRMC